MEKNNIKRTLGYNLGGISHIWLLNIHDFISYKFEQDKLSDRCLVNSIIASSVFFEVDAINESNYTETYSEGVYKQKLATFIYPLTSEKLSNLLTVKKGKYLVAFRTVSNKFFCFGGDGGASVSFSQQSGKDGDNQGYSITIEKSSSDPLYEVSGINSISSKYKYAPIFEDGVYCQTKKGKRNGFQIASYAIKTTLKNQPVDINGNLCSESGLPQVIQLLKGFRVPTGNFTVEKYYNDDTTHIQGYSIIRYNPGLCPPDSNEYLYTDPQQIIFDNDTNKVQITLISSHAWQIQIPGNPIGLPDKISGKAGKFKIKYTSTGSKGMADHIISNGKRKLQLNISNTDTPIEWVLLKTSENDWAWSENGLWIEKETWNY